MESWKSKFDKKTIVNVTEGESDNKAISDKFANLFKNVFVPNDPKYNVSMKNDFLNCLETYAGMDLDIDSIDEQCTMNNEYLIV